MDKLVELLSDKDLDVFLEKTKKIIGRLTSYDVDAWAEKFKRRLKNA